MDSNRTSDVFTVQLPISIPVSVAHPALASSLPMRKKPSAFCGEYLNSTRIDNELGVLSNECFINGLSFVPNIVFVLIAVPVLISWNKSIFANMHVKTWVRFPHHTARWLLMFVLLITSLFEMVGGVLSDELLGGVHLHLYIPHLASVAGTLMSAIYYHSVEMWNSPRFLLLLLPYWLASMVIEVMKALNLNMQHVSLIYMRPHLTRASIVLYMLLLIIELDILRQLRYAFFKKRRILKPPESLAETNYVQSAVSLPSEATYFWMHSILEHALRNPIELKDLGRLPESERCDHNYGHLAAAMEEERTSSIERQSKMNADERSSTTVVINTTPSLWKCYWAKTQSMMLLSGFFMLVGSLLHLMCPILLIYIIQFVESRAAVSTIVSNVTLPPDGDLVSVSEFFTNGYLLSVLLFMALILMNTFLQAGNFLVIREGVRLRGALQLLVYTKTLSLSMWNFTSQNVSVGQIINHLSVDTNNMLFYTCICHFFWLLPLKVLLSIIMVFYLIGWSAIVGGVVVLLLAVLQYFVAAQLSVMQRHISECADVRLKRCTEMLQNIKPLKLYAWEKFVSDRVEEARQRQLGFMLKAAILKAVSIFISEAGSIIFLLLAFTLHPFLGTEPLTPRSIFPTILLSEVLSMPIQLFPVLVNFMLNAQGSTRKLSEFLGAVEVDNKRHNLQKPKYHKSVFRIGGGSTQSSLSTTNDDGRFSDHRLSMRMNRDGHLHPGEVAHQLSVIQEDRANNLTDHGLSESCGGGTPKDDRKKKKKLTKQKVMDSVSVKEPEADAEKLESDDKDNQTVYAAENRPTFAIECVEPNASVPLMCDSSNGAPKESGGLLSATRMKGCLSLSPSSHDLIAGDVARAAVIRPSTSRRSSRTDLNYGGGDPHRRTTSVISAANSYGSGLDDDDLIDPLRDVGVAVNITGGYFAWQPRAAEALLCDVNFMADAGRLTVIVGTPGSGKSSLIAAMLGEMTRMAGSITWKPGLTVCYVGNAPWILNASVQDNILFGRPMEKKRYKRVLRACALQADIDVLPDKDRTEIGDKGISLCMGQKTRISIARAIYSKADLIIMDDPFSSLDLPTASHIFEDGILHFCLMKRKRTVVLVTHELHFLPFAHAIYGMEKGMLAYHGRLQDVKEFNPDLFAVWQDIVRKARLENKLRAEREDTALTERLILRRKIRTLEFRRDVVQTILDEEVKTGSPKRVFLSGQTTHITIEEEHPGGDEMNPESPAEEDDFDLDIQSSQSPHSKMEATPSKKKKTTHLSLMMADLKKKTSNAVTSSSKYEGEKTRVLVTSSAVFMYLRSFCLPMAMLLLLCHVLRTSLIVASDFWLALWSEAVYSATVPQPVSTLNNTMPNVSANLWVTSEYYMQGYAVLICSAIVLCIVIALATELLGIRAAKILYLTMLRNVIRAPMRFFDSNAISKVMSRFSGDSNIIDDKLSTTLEHFLRTTFLSIAAIIVNGIISPYFLVAALVVLIAFLYVQRIIRASYRELHKLDSITKSPLLSHCVETLAGLRTIRAFREESRFWEEMEKLIDVNNSTHLWLNTANRWTGIRLDYLASVLVLSSAIAGISVTVPGYIGSNLIALGITYALLISGYLNWAVRSIADVEVQMTAVQRVYEYATIAPERQAGSETFDVAQNWPLSGEIIFHNVSIRYSGNVDPVVKNINIHIRPGEKVGICGRPGSGKSSLTLSLFGMVEVSEGNIYIDSVNITCIPPTLLRSRLATLPQDCVLISGSVRYNLDPEGIHSDDALWEALEEVNMKETIKYMSGQLDGVVTENGENFTVSHKQLLCLARVVLNKSKVVIVDEVMSVLNANTECILHRILKTSFKDRTVINLSHRASSLMDYDTVIVLDNGRVVEYDSPQNLLTVEHGIFASLLHKRTT